MSNDQAAEILVELNANNIEYEAPINQVEKFKMDQQMETKENRIIEAAKKLRGEILTPKAQQEFDTNSTGMRMYRSGNRNVAPIIYAAPMWKKTEDDDDFFQGAYEYGYNIRYLNGNR